MRKSARSARCITGTIVRMEDKVLTIRTSYAGDFSIKEHAIAAIATESSVQVGLSDDTSARGVVSRTEDGKLRVTAEKIEETLTFDV